MKINLLMNAESVLTGWTNVDPLNTNDGRVYCNLQDLSEVCAGGECDELRVVDILTYFSHKQLEETLTHYVSRLAKQGRILVSDFDAIMLMREVARRNINLNDANALLFGSQDRPYQYKRSLVDHRMVVSILTSLGLTIESIDLDNNTLRFIVEAIRK